MMGRQPYLEALDAGAQVILGGRGTDPAPWAALAMHHGVPPAPAWYVGKLLECACNAATPKKHDCLVAAIGQDYIEVEPANPELRCTPLSVSVQALHENASPITRYEPGGVLHMQDCELRAVSDRRVRITGMVWEPQPYTIKLEAAELAGYSAITFAGTRDPGLIGRWTASSSWCMRRRSRRSRRSGHRTGEPRSYCASAAERRDGRMGAGARGDDARNRHPGRGGGRDPGNRQCRAGADARPVTLLHTDFPGRLCREGNVAFPFSPSDIERGPVYQFTMQHVMETDDPLGMFPITYETV